MCPRDLRVVRFDDERDGEVVVVVVAALTTAARITCAMRAWPAGLK